MATYAKTGFWPAQIQGNQVLVKRFPVTAANGTNIFRGDVVANASTGGVIPATADTGTTQVGTVVALYDSNGVPVGSPNSSVATKYLPSTTAGFADVACALPNTIFVAYAGNNTNIASDADIFASLDHVATAGSTTTAVSGHVLNGSTKNTEANFQILGRVDMPDNAYGTYVGVYVRFLESMWGQVNPTTGV